MNSTPKEIPSANPNPLLDRREFVTALGAVGVTAALPGLASAAEANAPATGPDTSVGMARALSLAAFRNETTRQLTTFKLDRKGKTIPIPRGKRVTVGEVQGEGYIAQLWLTFPGWFWRHWESQLPTNPSILKTLILRIYFDGAAQPSVAAPAGDFFGAGLCEVPNFAARYFGTSSGGFFCKWPMPFRKGFRVEMENLDAEIDTVLFCNILYQLAPLPGEVGYFHAQFNTGQNDGPAPVMIAEAQGRGHFAGCALYMQGKQNNYLSFLEAPEYVFVDDDGDSPRIVGTGLEDYFLGGWYFREGPFIGPDHGVPVKDALRSTVAMYRVHEADAIHFQQRFKFTFVNPWKPERLKPFCYSSVAFLYLDKPEGQGVAIPSAKELLCWYRIRDTDHQSIP